MKINIELNEIELKETLCAVNYYLHYLSEDMSYHGFNVSKSELDVLHSIIDKLKNCIDDYNELSEILTDTKSN